MTPLQKNRLMAPSFVLALLVLLLIGLSAYRQGEKNAEAARWVQHTYEVYGDLAGVLSLTQDVWGSARGYVITGEKSYLDPFHNAVQLIPERIQHLRRLASDDPAQQRRLDALEPLIASRIGISQTQIDLRDTGGRAAAEQAVSGGEGKRVMDEIRRVIAEMEAAENQLLQRRAEELRASNARTLAFFMVLVALMAGLLIATMVLVRRDAAAQQRELELTEEARAYAQNIVDTVREPLLVLDAQLRVQSANHSFYQAFRLTPEETEGKPFCELGNGQWNISELQRRLGEILPQHTSFQDFEVECDFPGLGRRTMLLNARTLFRVGNNTKTILLAVEDITERQKAQAERDLLFTLSRDLIGVAGFDGFFKRLNPAGEKTLGFTTEELLAKPFLDFVHPEDREATAAETAKLASGVETISFENRYRCKDGSYKWLLWNATPSVDRQLSFAVARDITERKRGEEQLRQLNAELAERALALETANKELEAFTYSVSHDLRAPLRHISGFSRILTEEYGSSLTPEAQRYLQRIQEGTRRMGLLVDDLLKLGRVGRQEVRLQVAGLNSVVNEVVAELKAECEGRQVEWKVGGLPFVDCDPALMKQVFQNLLANALKFTRPRSQAVIEVGQKEQEGAPAVFVRDNGVGFNMKYADKLFGVFQRLHRPEDFEGTGVGLATVQRIVQKHGGRIWAEADLDKGATFYFTLGASEKSELKTKAATAGDPA